MTTVSLVLGYLLVLCDPLALAQPHDLPPWIALTVALRDSLIGILSVRTLRRYAKS